MDSPSPSVDSSLPSVGPSLPSVGSFSPSVGSPAGGHPKDHPKPPDPAKATPGPSSIVDSFHEVVKASKKLPPVKHMIETTCSSQSHHTTAGCHPASWRWSRKSLQRWRPRVASGGPKAVGPHHYTWWRRQMARGAPSATKGRSTSPPSLTSTPLLTWRISQLVFKARRCSASST